MQLIYLAAGRGSRLSYLTKNYPKCLVRIKNKTIIRYNYKFFSNFKKIYLVTGYKSSQVLKEIINDNKFTFKIIKNQKYLYTNMVYSAFLPKIKIKTPVIICYGDIIFDHKIFLKLLEFDSCLPVKSNWLNLWIKRFGGLEAALSDAEDLVVGKKGYLKSIGTKIKTKIPKYQFMGIIKLTFEDYLRLKKFFEKKNHKIDFTNFLNSAVKNKIIKIKCIPTTKKWFEIDTIKDVNVSLKEISKLKW